MQIEQTHRNPHRVADSRMNGMLRRRAAVRAICIGIYYVVPRAAGRPRAARLHSKL